LGSGVAPPRFRGRRIGPGARTVALLLWSTTINTALPPSAHDHRDDYDSNDSEGPRPAKRRRPYPSFSHLISKRTRKRRHQRHFNSRSRGPSKLAGPYPKSVQTEPQQPSPLISDDSDDSEAPRPAKRRRPSPSNSDPTSERSKHRLQRSHGTRSHTVIVRTHFEKSSSFAYGDRRQSERAPLIPQVMRSRCSIFPQSIRNGLFAESLNAQRLEMTYATA
jgi:hypothetical protein